MMPTLIVATTWSIRPRHNGFTIADRPVTQAGPTASLRLELWNGPPHDAPYGDENGLEEALAALPERTRVRFRDDYRAAHPPPFISEPEPLDLSSGIIEIGAADLEPVESYLEVPPGPYRLRLATWPGERHVARLWPDTHDLPAPALLGATARLTNADHYLFAFGDSATVTVTPPAEGDWAGAGPHAITVRVINERPRKLLRLELWNAPPPVPRPAPELSEIFPTHFPSGRLHLENPAGRIPDIFQVPSDHYAVRLSDWNHERYLAQLWPAAR